jgi:predicted lipid carrier protein YhbT
VATEAAVRTAIDALRARVNAATVADGAVPERSIICVVSDLGTAYRTELRHGKLSVIEVTQPTTEADARLTARSDDLVALLEGRLNVASAFLLGKVRIDATASDMLLIRKLF